MKTIMNQSPKNNLTNFVLQTVGSTRVSPTDTTYSAPSNAEVNVLVVGTELHCTVINRWLVLNVNSNSHAE
jgi:hypothetical protein